jgi:DNA (cytosine-5)-methyltransferase 1
VVIKVDRQNRLFDRSVGIAPRDGFTASEYFAGIGLARLGLERAGWTIEFANDLDAAKKAMHNGHFGPSPHYHLADIFELVGRPSVVPTTLLAHASFPCTDLSLAGARKGLNAGQSSAFWGWVELLRAMGVERRPKLLLIENVTGLLSSNSGADFRALVTAINDLGYAADVMMVDAAHFTPQSRPRLFVVGIVEGLAGPSAYEPHSVRESTVRPAKLIEAIQANADLRWNLAELPEPPPYGAVPLEEVLDRLPGDDPQWWSTERAAYLLNQMSDRHRQTADRMIAAKKLSYGAVFRRVRKGRSMAELRTDGLAGCLRTPKGGSGRQILFEAGRGAYRVRLMNPDECARLMGAEGYRVMAPLNQALFGFGDAVCVDAVAWVAEHRLNPVAERVLNASHQPT